MNWNKAIELLENGEANMVVTQAVLLMENGKTWLSFDGKEWCELNNRGYSDMVNS